MKKRNILLLLVAFVFSSPIAFAQKKEAKKNEKIKAMKVNFIKNELNLTESEEQNFWPVYNNYENDIKALRKKHKEVRIKYKGKSIDDMTDQEAEELIDSSIMLKEQKLALEKSFNDDLKAILPIKKVLKFHKTQRKFKRKLLKRMRGKKNERRNQKERFRNREMQQE